MRRRRRLDPEASLSSHETLEHAFTLVGADLREWARLRFFELYHQLPNLPDSPIEEVMLIGMVAVNIFHRFFEFAGAVSLVPRFSHALVKLQKRIGKYRADFTVEARVGDKVAGIIVIECDGKAFHEHRKKEDRERDSFMEQQGYIVMRFTGHEIRTNPIAPALKIAAACEDLFRKAVNEPVDKAVSDDEGRSCPQASTLDPQDLHEANADRYHRAIHDLSPLPSWRLSSTSLLDSKED